MIGVPKIFESKADDGKGGGGGQEKEKGKIYKIEDYEDLKHDLFYLLTRFGTKKRIENSKEQKPTDSITIEFLDSYNGFLKDFMSNNGLIDSDYSSIRDVLIKGRLLADENTPPEDLEKDEKWGPRVGMSGNNLNRFCEENNITDPDEINRTKSFFWQLIGEDRKNKIKNGEEIPLDEVSLFSPNIKVEDFKRFFDENDISDPEEKVFFYSIVCPRNSDIDGSRSLGTVIKGKKYKGLDAEDLDVSRTVAGKELIQLGIDSREFLKIINKSVDYHTYSRASISFDDFKILEGALKFISDKGDKGLKDKLDKLIQSCRLNNENIKKEKEQKHQELINAITGGIDVTPTTLRVIEKNLSPYDGGIKVINKDTLVVWEGRHSRSGNSGVAMYSDLSVYVNGHKQTKSFQWRDAYSSDNDNFGLRINKVTEAKSEDKGDKIEITVTTDKNQKHVFEFDKKEAIEQREKLSSEEQEAFNKHFEGEVERLMNQYNEWYKSSPKIPSTNGEKSYIEPRIVRQEIDTEYGFGIVQIERQTDHRTDKDLQMMNHLFLIKPDQPAQEIVENHGYQSEQKGQLSLINVNGIDGTVEYSVDGENKVYKI